MGQSFSRRKFLKTMGLCAASVFVAACTRETSYSSRTLPTRGPTEIPPTPTITGTIKATSPAAAATKASTGPTPTPEPDITTAAQALNRLAEGNQRWVSNKSIYPNTTQARRAAVVKGQKPFAIIFSCVDSRVPPEFLFDRGLGDLLVIRTAGHALDAATLGSIEFGAEELKIPLVMVLGHEKCGAITAVIDSTTSKTPMPGNMKTLEDYLKPAVEAGKKLSGDAVENAVVSNIELTVEKLRSSTILADLIKKGKLRVVGARYDLDTGQVEITVI